MLPMRSFFAISSFVLLLITLLVDARLANPQKKSKLCGNEVCDEILFKTRVKRVMGINNDPNFLKLTDGAIIDVVAVKFSDRFDIMEGKIGDSRGFFYTGAIDMSPYAEFLRSAISDKKEMQMISQDPTDFGTKRIIGIVHSEIDLVRDFNAKATEVAREMGLPPPELLPVPQPTDDSGHGHSHGPGGHGHSHGGHGHSHSHETVKAPEVTTTTPAPEAQPVINLNNVLGTPPTVDTGSIEEEMERFIREDEEKRKKAEELISSEVVPEDPKPSDSSVPQPAPVEIATPEPEVIQKEVPITPPTVTETPEITTPAPVEIGTPPPQIEIVTSPEPVTPPPQIEIPITPPTPAEIPVTIEPVEVVTPQPVENTPEVIDTPPQTIEVVPEIVLPEISSPSPQAEVITTTPSPIDVLNSETIAPEPEVVTPKEELGTCYKDDCEGLQNTTPPPPPVPTTPMTPPAQSQEDADFLKWEAERLAASNPVEERSNYSQQDMGEPPVSSGLIEFIRSTFGLGNITDASIAFYVNITFVIASLTLYVIVQLFSSSSEPDKFDRLAYFNLATKHKELELKLKAAEERRGEVAEPQNGQELASLTHQNQLLVAELQLVQTQRTESDQQWRLFSDEKQREIERLGATLVEYEQQLERNSYGGQETAKELDSVRSQLTEAQEIIQLRQQELDQLKVEKNDYQQRYDAELKTSQSIQLRLDEIQQLKNEIEVVMRDSELEIARLKEIVREYERNQNEGGSAGAESGGSGWSDFGDNEEMEENKKEETTPEASQVGIVQNSAELTVLNRKIGDLEKELAKNRALYEKEKEERENSLKNAQMNIEQLEKEKIALNNNLAELNKILSEQHKNSHEVGRTIKALQDESDLNKRKVSEAEAAVKKNEEKVREVECELKRWQNEYKKLETKSFHEVMQLKKQLDDVKTSQVLGGFSNPPLFGDFGGTSAERLGSPLDDPIWGEPEYPPIVSGGRQHMIPHQEDYFSSESMKIPTKKRNSRRSAVGVASPNEEQLSGKSKKENGALTSGSSHRRRSRSHGRTNVYNDPYAPSMPYLQPGSSDSSFMSHQAPLFAPLTRRHSKSGQLHYSSGGSNGGRSPPPEMPLLSAIPPPGVRKPSSKRIDPSLHGK